MTSSNPTSDKPVLRLWALQGIGLIIACPSGVIYSNQTGGYACDHPEMEGVFIPLMYPGDIDSINARERGELMDQQAELEKHFTGPKWRGHCYAGIDAETADFVDGVLAASKVTRALKVDRTMLKYSSEAWIHVLIPPDDDSELWEGLPAGAAVVTWDNSD